MWYNGKYNILANKYKYVGYEWGYPLTEWERWRKEICMDKFI